MDQTQNKDTAKQTPKTTKPKKNYNSTVIWLSGLLLGIMITMLGTRNSTEGGYVSVADVTEKLSRLEEQANIRASEAYEQGKAEAAAKKKPFIVPKTKLGNDKETLCMALVLYSEETQGSEQEMALLGNVLVNRVMDPRDDSQYRNTICGTAVAGAGSQFNGVKPYLKVIENIVWGEIDSYTPKNAVGNNLIAWERAMRVSKRWFNGEYTSMTTATHFLSLKSLEGPIPSWAKIYRMSGSTFTHILLTDHHIDKDGKMTVYTKANPFDQWDYNFERSQEGK